MIDHIPLPLSEATEAAARAMSFSHHQSDVWDSLTQKQKDEYIVMVGPIVLVVAPIIVAQIKEDILGRTYDVR